MKEVICGHCKAKTMLQNPLMQVNFCYRCGHPMPAIHSDPASTTQPFESGIADNVGQVLGDLGFKLERVDRRKPHPVNWDEELKKLK